MVPELKNLNEVECHMMMLGVFVDQCPGINNAIRKLLIVFNAYSYQFLHPRSEFSIISKPNFWFYIQF